MCKQCGTEGVVRRDGRRPRDRAVYFASPLTPFTWAVCVLAELWLCLRLVGKLLTRCCQQKLTSYSRRESVCKSVFLAGAGKGGIERGDAQAVCDRGRC